jgi:hypothetical protein
MPIQVDLNGAASGTDTNTAFYRTDHHGSDELTSQGQTKPSMPATARLAGPWPEARYQP